MNENKKTSSTFPSLIKKYDLFGISYNFQLDSQEKYKTFTGGIASLIFYLITAVLFFGFGQNLYNRKNPKVSFSSEITTYQQKQLSNKNFTLAFRVEDQNGIIQNNNSIIFQEVFYYSYKMQANGEWAFIKIEDNQALLSSKCSEMAETPEKERNYNISLVFF